MQYMLLIYSEPAHWESLPEAEREAIHEEYVALSRELREQDRLVSSHELQPAATAATVAVADEGVILTDGPFAETKEALGGYYLIEAESSTRRSSGPRGSRPRDTDTGASRCGQLSRNRRASRDGCRFHAGHAG